MWKGLEAGLKPLKKDEEERLRRVFDRIDKNADGVICISDLRDTMEAFHYNAKTSDLEDMIWEVDETLDKTVSYLEFNLMYRRIRQDTESVGMEPRKLFVVCDYMMNDKNGDGVVAMDEAVQLMFMRYGKSFSQDEIKSLFRNADGADKITFSDFFEYTERQFEAIAKRREDERAKNIKGRPKGRVPGKP